MLPRENTPIPWPWWRDLTVAPRDPCPSVFMPLCDFLPLKCERDLELISNQLNMAKMMDGTPIIVLMYRRFHTASTHSFSLGGFEDASYHVVRGPQRGTAGDL